MGLFGGNIDDSDVEKFNEKILDNELSKQLDRLDDTICDIWNDAWQDPSKFFEDLVQHTTGRFMKDKIIDDMLLNATDRLGGLLTGMGLPGGFGHPFKIRDMLKDNDNIETLQNYKTPTDTQFVQCKEVDGLSVWDTKGWWRCLFPDAIVRDRASATQGLSSILTKEMVQNDKQHKYGLFFSDYSGFLSWRSHMIKLAKEKQQQKEQQQRSLWPGSSTPEDMLTLADPENALTRDKKNKVVGSSSYTTFNTTENGHEQITELKTYYDDGSVSLKSEKNVFPSDGSKPTSEIMEKVMDKRDSKLDGWFWKK
ncbi:Mpm1p Ecym_6280 [Eremothecium cymbalariae DBVPG|uniref:Mitochondrial peculiar membrane protein 1 n=1 Tax=Eremothecium cymbalariae (strain CBS 270.75 / DBVPG 7215 / KCTC 17166 / NRRL Y-17582) TaxID=931890 RepID=G8JVI1_ERECY|nr:hypothetical protein Ecym_6280 [Eremothecium cymbalariae DBVPG\